MKRLVKISFILLALLYACNTPVVQSELRDIDAEIKIKAPKGTTVNNSILLLVKSVEPRLPLDIYIDNGVTIYKEPGFTNQKLELGANLFQTAGLYRLMAFYEQKLIASRSIRFKSKPIKELEIYTGPNTIIVGGKQESMLTVIPADEFDNPIIKDQKIKFKSNAPKNIQSNHSINNMLAYHQFTSGNRSTKVLIGVSHKNIGAIEQRVEETADWPQKFKIELVDMHPFADNRQYLRLRTNKITDNYDNQVTDGTQVEFKVTEAKKLVGIYKSIIIDGIANVYIKNPSKPATWTITANVGRSVKSNKLDFNFKQSIKEINHSYDESTQTLTIGPLISTLGQQVPDGTVINLNIQDKALKRETVLGKANFKLSSINVSAEDNIYIIVNGLSKSIKLK